MWNRNKHEWIFLPLSLCDFLPVARCNIERDQFSSWMILKSVYLWWIISVVTRVRQTTQKKENDLTANINNVRGIYFSDLQKTCSYLRFAFKYHSKLNLYEVESLCVWFLLLSIHLRLECWWQPWKNKDKQKEQQRNFNSQCERF